MTGPVLILALILAGEIFCMTQVLKRLKRLEAWAAAVCAVCDKAAGTDEA